MADQDFTPYGRIYLVTNTVNNKQYVGQTIKQVLERWKQHCWLQGKCRALESAIRKYGADAFTVVELDVAHCQDELNRLEQKFVDELSTIAPRGYNLRDGGGAGGKLSGQTIELLKTKAARPEHKARFMAMRQRPDVLEKQKIWKQEQWKIRGAEVKAAAQTPAAKEKHRASMLAYYSTPEGKLQMKLMRNESNATPEIRQKRKEAMLRRWSDEGTKKELGEKISAGSRGHKKKIDYSDDAVAHRKEIARRRWNDPAYRENMLTRNSDPEVVKKRGDAIRAGWAKRRERLAAEAAAST